MKYYDLMAAMSAGLPVMVRLNSPSYSTVIVGKVVGVAHRMVEGTLCDQAEIMERGKNSITICSFDKVEPLYEEK